MDKHMPRSMIRNCMKKGLLCTWSAVEKNVIQMFTSIQKFKLVVRTKRMGKREEEKGRKKKRERAKETWY